MSTDVIMIIGLALLEVFVFVGLLLIIYWLTRPDFINPLDMPKPNGIMSLSTSSNLSGTWQAALFSRQTPCAHGLLVAAGCHLFTMNR